MPLATYQPTLLPTRDPNIGEVQCILEDYEGDFVLRSLEDPQCYKTTVKEYFAQLTLFLIRTEKGTFKPIPSLGCRLRTDLIGKSIDSYNVLNNAKLHLNQDLLAFGVRLAQPAEVLPYDDKTIIINVVISTGSTSTIQQTYSMDTQNLTIEQIDGTRV